MSKKVVHHHHRHGIGLGTIFAAYLSYTTYQSIGWAIIHAFFGWFYVLYYWFFIS